MATTKKFNVSHGLSAGTGAAQKDIINNEGLIFDVGLLADLKTIDKSDTVGAINELYDNIALLAYNTETSEPMGVVDRNDSEISFDNLTKTFIIEPANGVSEFVVWTNGNRRVFNSAQTVSIGSAPNTGIYYIYFDSLGVLSYKTTYFTWNSETPIAYVYWNANTSKAEFVADERHGITLDWATHEYLHRTRGAVIANGFSASNFTIDGDGTSDSDAKLDISDGTFFDEDLKVSISHSNSPTVGSFTQILQGNAEIPVFYQSGASGSWIKDPATEFPIKYVTGQRISYNLLSGGNWITQQIDNNKYGVSWIIATNDIYTPIICILGQEQYQNIGDAEEVTFNNLSLPGFPVAEFRPLWKLIYHTSDSYSNTIKSRLEGVLDLRQFSSATIGKIVADHGLLSGLSDDDHSQYVHTSIDRTITANHTISGDLTLSGGLKDSLDSYGTLGQTLVSTGAGIEWRFPTATTNVLYVTKDGDDANSGVSLQESKATIKSALAASSAGTVIKVSAGTYVENNPLIMPSQVSVVGDSLREVTVTPQNNGDLFYVNNGCYISDMSFVGSSNTGAVFSYNPSDPPYISQSPYIQNCTNFIPGSQGLRIDGDHCLGPFKSMVVDSYTQYNQGGIGAQIKNEAYAQLVSMFTICCDTAIKCETGGACDLTNSNSSFGNYGLVSSGVSDLKYAGDVTLATQEEDNVVRIDISSTTYNVSNAIYNENTGELTLTTSSNHDFQVGMDLEIRDLIFSCDSGGGPSTQAFPSGAYGYIFSVKSIPSLNQVVVNVGTSDIVHTYVSGGTAKINKVRPFDGQVVHFDSLFYEVLRIEILNGGSGYTTPPEITIESPLESWGITAQAIAEISGGSVIAVEIVSSGRGYSSTPPIVNIAPPASGTTATLSSVLTPSYLVIQESREVSTDLYDVVFKNAIPYALTTSSIAYFYKQSRLLASGHSFEYIGSGTNIETAMPRAGGVPIQENETVSENGGIVVYTSTDHSGNFRIGDGVLIDQTLGRISGEFYSKSLFSTMTPLILALGGA